MIPIKKFKKHQLEQYDRNILPDMATGIFIYITPAGVETKPIQSLTSAQQMLQI
ncbi:MAG: hypothetical protein WD823_00275 [Sulfuricaulis sp.]|uniref:hypothetical protein n=1 Tax=Sulfuricaulis sp. TaxID=2003553 RepID=UPI0034A3C666